MATFTAKVTPQDPITSLVICLLHSVTNAHILHFQTPSFSEHMALGTFYSEIGDLVDSLVEAYQGKYGLITRYPTDFQMIQLLI